MRWVLVAAFALGGCPGPTDPEPDATPPSDVGIRLTWSTTHPSLVPGPAKMGVTIRSVKFNLEELRIISDAAPNDPRTTLQRLELRWGEGVAPQVNPFIDAPPGIYSRIAFALTEGGAEISYEITGTARIENVDVPFRIVDGANMTVSVMHKRATLTPGAEVDMGIRLDFEKVIDRVDIEELPLVEGVRTLDESDSQIEDVRKAIKDDLFRDGDDDIH